jgi:phage tail tube protein FII
MQRITITGTTEYWSFVKVDNTSTTEYTATTTDELEVKLKSLLTTIPIGDLKVVSETTFTSDLLFV